VHDRFAGGQGLGLNPAIASGPCRKGVQAQGPLWPATANSNAETPAKVRTASQADVFSGDDLLDGLFGIPGQL
jgi:hypothetical protein